MYSIELEKRYLYMTIFDSARIIAYWSLKQEISNFTVDASKFTVRRMHDCSQTIKTLVVIEWLF